ncbi:MAG TPA: TMEM165/GDT1 family protein [Casimicrobiaceae bacterium]|nr:TMEM165/GDT1 family protein [Casimicrobiaceae bacterium]
MVGNPLEAFLVSAGVVALGEIGDKTQLLAMLLAARFRKPWPVILGILAATLVNHTLAGYVGTVLRSVVPADWLQWAIALSFFAVAVWALKPDAIGDDDAPATTSHGVFVVTAVAFFLAEMGDKTQVATAILASRFGMLAPVVAGTTLGMLIVDVPTVLFGGLAAKRLPLRAIRIAAALMFAVLGVAALVAPAAY